MEFSNKLAYLAWTPVRLWHEWFPSREEFILRAVLSKRSATESVVIPYKDWRGICKSALLLMSEHVLTYKEKIGIDVLVRARRKARKNGTRSWRRIDLRKLDRGNKGLLELFEEIRKGECELFLRPHDLRFRRMARRVRVFIRSKDGLWSLREVARQYFGEEPKAAMKLYAVSGSIHANELHRLLLAAQREVREELREEYPLEWFSFALSRGNGTPGGEHESDAYAGGFSVNQDHDVVLTLEEWPQEWFEKPPIIDDTRVRVFTACVREEPIVKEPEPVRRTVPISASEIADARKAFGFP
ncbi:MAG TPA: hypothetical protein VG984_03030 [Candidatus Paceibacterota bacterium]|nr:hypothetical protein [Candidatus Paceibacterota bacterium]